MAGNEVVDSGKGTALFLIREVAFGLERAALNVSRRNAPPVLSAGEA